MNEIVLIGAAVLLLISVLASKISDRFGIPALLLFLVIGMLAGSDGPGGIYFDDPELAQFIGVIALIFILFSGGLDTDRSQVRPVLREGIFLATLGVVITALAVGLFASLWLGYPPLMGLLLGAIVSSTDAAAVFSVLRSKGISLKGRLKPLLELESGSNDPMAVFLTIGLIEVITQPELSAWQLAGLFVQQMAIGGLSGYGMGRGIVWLVNRIKLNYEGLYPALILALVLLTFAVTDLLGGSGFLAVYLVGVVLGNREFIHRRSMIRFYDGLAWLMQIAMFLTLGLLVYPSRLVPVIDSGLLITAWLMFIARPLSVFLGLLPSKFHWREKLLISWVGLRGAVPIILATFPLLARVPQADLIFNLIFFVVLASVLLQGTTIPLAARWLKVDAPYARKPVYPIEYTPVGGFKSELKELRVPLDSCMAGKAIFELGLPDDFLVVLIARENDFILPSGGTLVQGGDTLLVLADNDTFEAVRRRLTQPKTAAD
ncbi:MAG: potassium/proton antiporter [Chloroflexota bacterium]|jgi:cell volume regulation protein A